MQLILLSGGSGKRLWPLSNDAYSKQFLRLLPAPGGTRESMLQRIMRQVKDAGLGAAVTIATGKDQCDPIFNQLDANVNIVTEPERRDTFPAIALACLFLEKERQCELDEVVVVMPSDPYTDEGYFRTIRQMAEAVEQGVANLVLMGIQPTCVSTKYGYIVSKKGTENTLQVERFTEKPDENEAKNLVNGGALWNGGVFAFRLGYLLDIVRQYVQVVSFTEAVKCYERFPKISFDYEVVEKATSVAVVPFCGVWKDLGTWDTLSEVIGEKAIGNVQMDDESRNTNVVNILGLPCICVGTNNLMVAASPDGVLVADKTCCERIKPYINKLSNRPMYEERRWGTYKVIDWYKVPDEPNCSLTKHLCIKTGKYISYQRHSHRDEIWIFINGAGLMVLDDEIRKVRKGEVVSIRKGQKHAVKATADLHIIEVQMGDKLFEEDIERFDWNWPEEQI